MASVKIGASPPFSSTTQNLPLLSLPRDPKMRSLTHPPSVCWVLLGGWGRLLGAVCLPPPPQYLTEPSQPRGPFHGCENCRASNTKGDLFFFSFDLCHSSERKSLFPLFASEETEAQRS